MWETEIGREAKYLEGIVSFFTNTFLSSCSFFKITYLFFWRIVDLQCCVSFRCIAKRFSYIYIYTHTHICVYIYIYLFYILSPEPSSIQFAMPSCFSLEIWSPPAMLPLVEKAYFNMCSCSTRYSRSNGELASGHVGRGLDSVSRDMAAGCLRAQCLSALVIWVFSSSSFTFFLNQSIVNLQCCASLCCTAQWLHFICIYILFKKHSFPFLFWLL